MNREARYIFIYWSSELTPNVLDWIRSIYFSLLGSSMLTFSLKVTVLSTFTILIFIIGILAFLIGLFISVSIANRYKRHEKNYDALSEPMRLKKKPEGYSFEQEKDCNHPSNRNVLHFLLYSIWIPALLCIGYAGFFMENKSTKSSLETKTEIQKIEIRCDQIDSTLNLIRTNDIEKKILQDSLNTVLKNLNWQIQQNDLLKIKLLNIRQEELKNLLNRP